MSGDTKLSCPELNSADAIQWAADNGLEVILPENNQLLLDIDNNFDRGVFDQNRAEVDTLWGIAKIEEWKSRSGKAGKSHIRVTLKVEVGILERIMIQAILGSDRRRETHSIRRYRAGEKNPTLLFEIPKYMSNHRTIYDTSESA